MSEIATIVEDPDTTQMSVRPPIEEEKIHQKGEVEEKNHLQEREGVEMIVMNEEHHGEERIQNGRTSHQGATQNVGANDTYGVTGIPSTVGGRGVVRRAGLT